MNAKSGLLVRFFGGSNEQPYERLKVILLALTIFLIIGAYTLVRELKNSIFMAIVGKEYIPIARIIVMVGLIPAILFYSFLVDKLRRYQLLYFYSLFYGIGGLVSVYLVGHPVIGLINTDSSPFRFFGWIFYFFTEAFTPFVISVFWSFANSIYSPDGAKKNYAVIVTGSKIGGMLTAGIAWFIFSCSSGQERMFSDVAGHQIMLIIFSLFVLLIPFAVSYLMHTIPGQFLHGYEAVYQFEKDQEKKKEESPGILSGLFMLVRWPYILGIFGMLFFYEVISSILSYHRLGVAQSTSPDISGVSCFLFQIAFIQHFFGILISFLGTRTLLRIFGERICLLLIPSITALCLIYFTFSYTPLSVLISLIMLQAVNYAFAQPVRESLYIPTIKDIKFKSKSWIDAFGSRCAKGVGSVFNIVAINFGESLFFSIHSIFFFFITLFWFFNAYWIGKRYEKAIKNEEVIGEK